MPGRPPSKETLLRLLDKHNISIDDQSVTVLIPQFRLGGLANARRTKKKYSFSVLTNQRTM